MKRIPLGFISAMLVIGTIIEITVFHAFLWQTEIPLALALFIAWVRKDPHAR
jgi:hypothetical protein